MGVNLARQNIQNIYPLSPMQEGMLFHALAQPDSPTYLQQLSYRVREPLHEQSLRNAWRIMVDRHDILRTVFSYANSDRPLQIVLRETDVALQVEDLRSMSPDEQERRLDVIRSAALKQRFDLTRDTLSRTHVVQLAEDAFEVVWTHHHILLDGWSMAIVQGEFATAYRAMAAGRQPELAPVEPFAEYIRSIESADRETSLAYWREVVGDCERSGGLPHRTNPAATDERRKIAFTLPASAVDKLTALSGRHSATLSTALHALWALLMGRSEQNSDVVFGSVVSGRPPALAGAERMVGLLINTVPVRVRLDETTGFGDLLSRLQEELLAAEPHHHLPLATVQGLSPLGQDLITCLVAFENFPIDRQPLAEDEAPADELRVVDVQGFEQTHYPLTVQFLPGESFDVRLSYDPGYYEPEQIDRVEAPFLHLLRRCIDQPTAPLVNISLLSATDARELADLNARWLRGEGSGTAWGAASGTTEKIADTPELSDVRSLTHAFRRQVERWPDRVAVVCEGRKLTYAQLDSMAASTARWLRQRGVVRGDRVGVRMERSEQLIAALIGVLQTGAAYVPLDPVQPDARLEWMADDAGVKLVLDGLPDDHDGEIIDDETAEHDVAYIIYTSGSTGRAKGVEISHGHVLSLLRGTGGRFGFGLDDVWTLFHSYGFDFSVWELWGALAFGGRLVVVPYWTSRSPESFLNLLEREQVTVLNQTPSAFYGLMDADAETAADGSRTNRLSALRLVIFGGEQLELRRLAAWYERHDDRCPLLVNMYGITETTVHVTWRALSRRDVEQGHGSVIGIPIPGWQVHVLDASGQPAPVGIAGEMFVGGAGVSSGYCGRPGLSAERFVPDPFSPRPGARLYRSGDLARITASGELEYLGRIDDQIQLRGHRVEPGEIASVVEQHDDVERCLVLERDGQLVAWVVPKAASEVDRPRTDDANVSVVAIDPATLREWTAGRLPSYMVPAAFVGIDRVPLTRNGKLARTALPDPCGDRSSLSAEFEAPRSEPESTLADVLADVLSVERVGIHDDFFALGGDSIKSIQLLSRLRRRGYLLTMRDLFQHPTVARLAPYVRPVTSGTGRSQPDDIPDDGRLPLTPIQLRFLTEHLVEPEHFNHAALLRSRQPVRLPALQAAVAELWRVHAGLRVTFARDENGRWHGRRVDADVSPQVEIVDLSDLDDPVAAMSERVDEFHRGFDPETGPLARVVCFQHGDGDRVLLVVHHLLIDGLSWRIALEDLNRAYASFSNESGATDGSALTETPDNGFTQRAHELRRWSESDDIHAEQQYWADQLEQFPTTVDRQLPDEVGCYRDSRSRSREFDESTTHRLVDEANQAYQTATEELLLTAVARAWQRCTTEDRLAIAMESHGRDILEAADSHAAGDVDLSRTVGWFTSLFPLVLRLQGNDDDPGHDIKTVKDARRSVPNGGIGYGVLRYLAAKDTRHGLSPPPDREWTMSFNYLGRFGGEGSSGNPPLIPTTEPSGVAVSPNATRSFGLEFSGVVFGDRLQISFNYSTNQWSDDRIEELLATVATELNVVIDHCCSRTHTELTSSDLTYSKLSVDELDALFD